MALRRKAITNMMEWKRLKTKQALLVSGARQVGKTFLIREFARKTYDSVVEINLIDMPDALDAFSRSKNADDLFLRITAFASDELIAGKTAIFIDEIQECKEIATALKFLVDKYGESYDFIASGSLLGVELRDIRSIPVGYLNIVEMYPLDFEEFCWANGVPSSVIDEAREAFTESRPVDEYIDRRLSDLFHRYLIVGGMPDPVQAFVRENNLQQTRRLQNGIVNLYRHDISKYAGERARVVRRVFDLIPAELNTQSKRFVSGHIEGISRFDKYDNDFTWLTDAGVSLPTYNVDEPRYPLELSVNPSFFKLFMNDVGLLTCLCGMNVVRNMLADRADVNYGSLYENYVAQELTAHGFGHPSPDFHLYYYKGRKLGELDFLIEKADAQVVPIEVKSGKDYKRHNALSNVLAIPNYGIRQALVLHEGNIEVEGAITYLPMYATMFINRTA